VNELGFPKEKSLSVVGGSFILLTSIKQIPFIN
jgi:hypothetical protein